MTQPITPDTTSTELREKLAAIEHGRWSDWQEWCHKVLRDLVPSVALEKVLERWDRQIATPYKDLTPEEKASDMEQVDRYWSLIEAYVAQRVLEAKIDECTEIANTVAKNKQGIVKVMPLTANDIEEWLGRRMRNYVQNGAQDILLKALGTNNMDKP